MPKDFRERIIDEKPFRVVTMRPKQNTTSGDTEPPAPTGIVSTPMTIAPGDAVVWFLRLDSADAAPSGHLVSLLESDYTTPVGNTYFTPPSGWADYIDYFNGDAAFDEAGLDFVTNDAIYVVFDQLDGFTEGTYVLSWDLPVTDRAHVEKAYLLKNVDDADQGTYYYGPYQLDLWEAYHGIPSDVTGFPVSVPLTATDSYLYTIFDMAGSVTQPAGYNSVPGTQLLAYTFLDPTAPPALTQTIFARVGALTGGSASIAAPSEDGQGTGEGTSYRVSAVVLNGTDVITSTAVVFA